jgi:hypothetical protein
VGWTFAGESIAPSPDGTRLVLTEMLRDLRVARRIRMLDTRTGAEVARRRLPLGVFYPRYRWSDDSRSVEFVTARGLMGVIEAGSDSKVRRPLAGEIRRAEPRDHDWLLTVTEGPVASLVAADVRTGESRELLQVRASDAQDRYLVAHLIPTGPGPGAFVFAVQGYETRSIEGAWYVRGHDVVPIPYEPSTSRVECYMYRQRCYESPDAAASAFTRETGTPAEPGWYEFATRWISDTGDGLYHIAPASGREHEGVLRAWDSGDQRWSVIHDRVVLRGRGTPRDTGSTGDALEPDSELDFWHSSVGQSALLYARRASDDRIEIAWYDRDAGWNDTVAVFDEDAPDSAVDPTAFLGWTRIVREDAPGPVWIQIDLQEPGRTLWKATSSVLFRVDPIEDRVDRVDSLPPIQVFRIGGVFEGRVLFVAATRDAGTTRPWRWLDVGDVSRDAR